MSAAHTPGPWGWFGQGNGSIYLATRHSGRRFVMGFTRKGRQFAQPTFQPDGRGMVDAADLLQFEVGDQFVVGMKSAKANKTVYRYDIRGIDCADARLIAAAPDLLAALKVLVGRRIILAEGDRDLISARAAIARAEGKAP